MKHYQKVTDVTDLFPDNVIIKYKHIVKHQFSEDKHPKVIKHLEDDDDDCISVKDKCYKIETV